MTDESDSTSLTARLVSGPGAAVWSTAWILLWFAVTVTWVAYGLWAADFTQGGLAFLVLFVPFEAWGVRRKNDAYPPLTHVIRNRFPGWFAFPLMFATVAAVVSRWASLEWRPVGFIVLATASLGWLTEHFIATYGETDPRPFTENRTTRAA